MSERPAQVAQHLETVRELGEVIAAMRGIAAARAREARDHLDAVRAYADTLGTAIGEALALLDDVAPPGPAVDASPGGLAVALCAEQGFAGNFSERVLDAVAAMPERAAGVLLVGERGALHAAERSLPADWTTPMAAHLDEVPALAERLAEAVYARLDDVPLTVTLVHALPGEAGTATRLVQRTLLPFDYRRFPIAQRRQPPATQLDATTLIEALAGEYVYAELVEAIVLSLVAENEARLQAMIAAQGNIDQRRDELTAAFNRARQDAITEEIVELSASRL